MKRAALKKGLEVAVVRYRRTRYNPHPAPERATIVDPAAGPKRGYYLTGTPQRHSGLVGVKFADEDGEVGVTPAQIAGPWKEVYAKWKKEDDAREADKRKADEWDAEQKKLRRERWAEVVKALGKRCPVALKKDDLDATSVTLSLEDLEQIVFNSAPALW